MRSTLKWQKISKLWSRYDADSGKKPITANFDQTGKTISLTRSFTQGIGLRAYGQRDPLNEYKKEAFEIFEDLLNRIRESVTTLLADIEMKAEMPMLEVKSENYPEMMESREDPYLVTDAEATPIEESIAPIRNRQSAATIDPEDPSTWGKVARNAPCPCGSGKKYKHCHGKLQ